MIETRPGYIHENPVRAGLVAESEDYLYSSAGNYAEMESFIEIDFIGGRSCKLRPGKDYKSGRAHFKGKRGEFRP